MDIFSTITAAGVAGLIFSLINCLFGFRLQKFWVGLVCFLFGGVVLSLIASHLTSTGWVHATAFFVGGAVLAALSFRLYLPRGRTAFIRPGSIPCFRPYAVCRRPRC